MLARMTTRTVRQAAAELTPLRDLREGAGMSRHALAIRSGVGTSTIARIEYGEVTPRLVTRRALAQALGVPVAQLWPEPYDAQAARYVGSPAE
jgi:transcriptional regulator with XRE-family HTH domain